MIIAAIADLHGRLPELRESADVLVIAGDIAPDFPFSVTQCDPDLIRVAQMQWLATEFAAWEASLPVQNILVTPGNHDWWTRMPENCASTVLIDEQVNINGVSFYGTPWVPECGDFNYMLGRWQRKVRFEDIPTKLDVLIAHSPAHKVLDRSWDDLNLGCPELRQAIQDKKPRHVFFGHIHEGRRDGLDKKLGDSQMHHVSMWKDTDEPRFFTLDKR